VLNCCINRLNVTSIGMACHAHAGVNSEHPIESFSTRISAISNDHHASVQRVTHTDTTTMMKRNPGCPRNCIHPEV
ncbi:uncharacterized protein METZ01_LOCUS290759, partial [marine metagenome]